MTITVDYDALDLLTARLRGIGSTIAESSPNAQTYTAQNVKLSASDLSGALALAVRDTTQQVEESLSTWTRDTEKALAAGADAVDACRRAYEDSDASVVESFEGKYTPADVAPAGSSAESTASACLTPAEADTDFDKVFSAMGLLGNSVSATFWLGTAADWVLDRILEEGEHDPFKLIGTHLAGDWKPISKASNGLAYLSDYFGALDSETKSAWNDTNSEWTGGASDSAGQAFSDLAQAFGDVSSNLHSISSEYNAVAVGVYQLADELTTLLRTMADYALLAFAEFLAGLAAAETIVGAVAGFVAAAASFIKVLQVINQIRNVLDVSWQLAYTFAGQCALWLGMARGTGEPVAIPMPAFSEE